MVNSRQNTATVYLLQHVIDNEAADDEPNIKLIGVYSTEHLAEIAIDRLRKQPGFRDYPLGFEIVPQQLNHDGWKEGFGFVDLPKE